MLPDIFFIMYPFLIFSIPYLLFYNSRRKDHVRHNALNTQNSELRTQNSLFAALHNHSNLRKSLILCVTKT